MFPISWLLGGVALAGTAAVVASSSPSVATPGTPPANPPAPPGQGKGHHHGKGHPHHHGTIGPGLPPPHHPHAVGPGTPGGGRPHVISHNGPPVVNPHGGGIVMPGGGSPSPGGGGLPLHHVLGPGLPPVPPPPPPSTSPPKIARTVNTAPSGASHPSTRSSPQSVPNPTRAIGSGPGVLTAHHAASARGARLPPSVSPSPGTPPLLGHYDTGMRTVAGAPICADGYGRCFVYA